MHARAKQELPGSPDQKQLRLGPRWYALGLSTNKPARFQGFHGSVDAPDDPDADIAEAIPEPQEESGDDYGIALDKLAKLNEENPGGILLVFDEAAGIDQPIFDAAHGALTSPESYVLMIGNPDLDLAAEHSFVKSHQLGTKYVTIRCSAEKGPEDALTPDFAFDRPPNWLVSRQWVEDSKREYGLATPLCYSKVWGQFAGSDASARVMPHETLMVAEGNIMKSNLGIHIGVDVAAEGGDENVAALLVDGLVRSMDSWRARTGDRSPLMSVANRIIALRQHWAELIYAEGRGADTDSVIPWQNIHVDVNGIGKGVCERLAQRGYYCDPVDNGAKPKRDWKELTGKMLFLNRRAELHWVLRRAAEEGMFSMPRTFLEAWRQAQWAEYEHREMAQGTTLSIIPKKQIRKTYKRSPDHWDAVLLSYSRAPSKRLRVAR